MKQRLRKDNSGKVLFLPIFFAATISNFLDCVSVLVDETIVGNLFEDAAFGAINVIEPYQMVESFLSYLICVGGVALIIRADGQKSYERVNELFSHCITACLLLGLICFTIYSVFGNLMADAVSGGTETRPYVLQAISWNRLDALVEPLYIFLFTYTLLKEGSLYALGVTIIEISSNALMSVLLGKTMGIGGVVLATGIAFCIGILLIILFLIFRKTQIRVRPCFKTNLLKEISVISFPESSLILSLAFLEAVINHVGLRGYGVQGIVVAAVVINVFEIVIYVSEGISGYETAALNKYLGQGDRERISECIHTTVRAAVGEGFVFSVLYFSMAEPLVTIFDINDPVTCELAVRAVRMIAFIPVIMCFTRIFAIFFQYTKRVGRAVLLIALSWGLFPGVLGWLLGQMSIEGLTLGVVFGSSVVLFLMILYIKIFKKEKIWEYDKYVEC